MRRWCLSENLSEERENPVGISETMSQAEEARTEASRHDQRAAKSLGDWWRK